MIAAAREHYGYAEPEARDYLHAAAGTVARDWQGTLSGEGMPKTEVERFRNTFSFAESLLR